MHNMFKKGILTVAALLSLLPLSMQAQRLADAAQLQKLISVYRRLAELYVDEVDMTPLT